MDVAGGAYNKPGALVVLNQCSNAVSQQRAPVQGVSGGIATNPDFAPATCLDSSGGPTVGGYKQLVVNDCNSGTSQNWTTQRLEIAGPGHAVDRPGPHQLYWGTPMKPCEIPAESV